MVLKMQLKLNKYDIVVTVLIIGISLLLMFFILRNDDKNSKKIAHVYYHNKIVHTFDLSKKESEIFKIEATNGLVKIESKDGKVRVINETSKHHICSIQGWSDSTINPIVCLPNNLYIKIITQEEDEVDVFIK